MSLMEFLGLGKQAGDAIAQPVEAVGNVLDKLFTSDDERLSREEARLRLAQKPNEAQTEINKLEAQHRSTFVAGWRPSIGWVCSASLGMYFIPQYAMAAIIWSRACWNAQELIPYPVTSDGLMELIMALLGMGSIRMVEKLRGKAK